MAARSTRARAKPDEGSANVSRTVGLRNAVCARMAGKWALVDALRGGRKAMIEGATDWLPKHDKEKAGDYSYRLANSHLHTGYVDTIDRLATKPFQKLADVKDKDKLPPRLGRVVAKNVDNEGTSFDAFWKKALLDSMHHGLTHVLVDLPPSASADAATESKLFPYLVHIPASNVRNFKSRRGMSGELALTEIVYAEPRDEWNESTNREESREYLRQWRFVTQDDIDAASQLGIDDAPKASVALWRKHWTENEWTLADEPRYVSFVGVPIVTHYTRRVGFMEGEPALQGLAELNLEHWQSYSDQKRILNAVRCAILAGFGLTEEDTQREIVVGPNYTFLSRSPGNLQFVEHTGAGIESGWKDLSGIEGRMETKGLAPLLERAGDATATRTNVDENEGKCELQSWTRDLEESAAGVVRIAGEWIGEAQLVPEKLRVNFFTDFALSARSANDQTNLLSAKRDGILADKVVFNELKKRGLISEDVTWEENRRLLDEQGPALGDITDAAFGGFGGESPSNEQKPEPPKDDATERATMSATVAA